MLIYRLTKILKIFSSYYFILNFSLVYCREAPELRVEAVLNNTAKFNSFIQFKINRNLDSPIDIDIKPTNIDKDCRTFTILSGIQITQREVYLPLWYGNHDDNIIPNCTYDIIAGNDKITYKVPECIANYCSCNFLDSLNITVADVGLSSNLISIKWIIFLHRTLPDFINFNLSIKFTNMETEAIVNFSEQLKLEEKSQNIIIGNYYFNEYSSSPLEMEYRIEEEKTDHCDNSGYRKYNAQILKLADPHPQRHISYFLLIVCALIISIAIMYFSLRKFLKYRTNNSQVIATSRALSNMEYNYNIIYVTSDELEVHRSSLKIGEEIGDGAFGRVFIARAININGKNGETTVAIKQLKEHATSEECEDFLREINTLKKLGHHPNIIRLLGCCTIKQPYLMIMEYVGFGDLLRYLRLCHNRREMKILALQRKNGYNAFTSVGPVSVPIGKYLQIEHPNSDTSEISIDECNSNTVSPNILRPSVTETMYTVLSDRDEENYFDKIQCELDGGELHNFALQIAKGMQHLEQHKIIHRDLAARNILIGDDKTLKISDFGLSRYDIYVNTKNKKVPLRWLSLEAIKREITTSKSDVWSFAVVLWEIGTLGRVPYTSIPNHEILTFLEQGGRLQRPENCTRVLYDLMLACWAPRPEDRPSFVDIVRILENDQKLYIDFDDDCVFSSVRSSSNIDETDK